jgi:hypothetical protein
MSELAEGLEYIAKWGDIFAFARLRNEDAPEIIRSATKELTPEHQKEIIGMVLLLNDRKVAA